jgi:hypothetical protein
MDNEKTSLFMVKVFVLMGMEMCMRESGWRVDDVVRDVRVGGMVIYMREVG